MLTVLFCLAQLTPILPSALDTLFWRARLSRFVVHFWDHRDNSAKSLFIACDVPSGHLRLSPASSRHRSFIIWSSTSVFSCSSRLVSACGNSYEVTKPPGGYFHPGGYPFLFIYFCTQVCSPPIRGLIVLSGDHSSIFITSLAAIHNFQILATPEWDGILT